MSNQNAIPSYVGSTTSCSGQGWVKSLLHGSWLIYRGRNQLHTGGKDPGFYPWGNVGLQKMYFGLWGPLGAPFPTSPPGWGSKGRLSFSMFFMQGGGGGKRKEHRKQRCESQ